MHILGDTPLERAEAKRDQLEYELRRYPDFQLYLFTKSPEDRARMKRLLLEIPNFRLWRALTYSIERSRRLSAARPSSFDATFIMHRDMDGTAVLPE
jgi:hypothetical protein